MTPGRLIKCSRADAHRLISGAQPRVMYRRAAVAGPANPFVTIVVAVGLVVVALVSVAVRAGAATTAPTPAPTVPCLAHDLGPPKP